MRDYDPTTGRYIQGDPLGLVDGPSVYGYALQNPGRYVDPTGEAIPLAAMAARAAWACAKNPACRAAAAGTAYAAYQWMMSCDDQYSLADAGMDFVFGAGAGWGTGKASYHIFKASGPFSKGSWMNTGRNWRLGWSRKGGNRVFRYADKKGRKIDFYDDGPL